MKRILTVVALVFAFAALTGGHCKPGPTPIEPEDTDKCAAACQRLQELKCPEAEPLADGTTCVQFCEQTQRNGHALNPTCIATVKSCAEVNTKCNRPQYLFQ